MKNILVTGASGLLGSHVVKHLLSKECHVIVSILPEEKSTYQPLDGVEVIINDDIFQGKFPHISTVINCAFSRSNQSQDHQGCRRSCRILLCLREFPEAGNGRNRGKLPVFSSEAPHRVRSGYARKDQCNGPS